MPDFKVASREEWLEARVALLKREKELTWERERIAEARRQLPWVPVEDYQFDGDDGPIMLSDLFNGHSQLAIYHFMYDPEWDAGCKSCSFWVDNFHGIEPHLAAQDIAFALVSKAGRDKTAPFQKRMGWNFNWVSAANNSFNEDFKVSFHDRKDMSEPIQYNYGDSHFPVNETPGMSIFNRDEEGRLYHSYSTFARGLDMLNGAYHIIDLTPMGRDEEFPMDWLRHHDAYEKSDQAA